MAERLRQARVDTRMTQRIFADKLGVSLRTLRNLETGRSYPKAKHIQAYATLTGKPFDYFLSSEGTTP